MAWLRRACAALSTLLCALPALADPSPAFLVKDLNTQPTPRVGIYRGGPFVVAGNTAYFIGYTTETGTGLWKTDGTAAGTGFVIDRGPGFAGTVFYILGVVGDTLYLLTSSKEVLKSDGTAAGTVLVKAGDWFIIKAIASGGALYFVADSSAPGYETGYELWKTDGTAAGTVMVRDICPGCSAFRIGTDAADVNGVLFFPASDGTHGIELWKSDGTAAGTVMVKDIRPGSASSLTVPSPASFTNVNGTLYFTADDGVNGLELWKSDGTEAGTVLVANIAPGSASANPTWLARSGGTLFFAANDGTHGSELWKTDGTTAGTVLVRDSVVGAAGSNPFGTAAVNGLVYYASYDDEHGYRLWKSDGTSGGTELVSELRPWWADPRSLTPVGDMLYFAASDGTHSGIWKSDGTSAGTVLLKDVVPSRYSDSTGAGTLPAMSNLNGELLVYASSAPGGEPFWTSDGTEAGTGPIPGYAATASSSFTGATAVNGRLLFITGDTDREVWITDGTSAGTIRLADGSVNPYSLLNVNGTVYFAGRDADGGSEPWKTDGTPAGTVRIKDTTPSPGRSVGNFTNVNGTVFFSATNPSVGATDTQLWKTDGTEAGTVLLKSFTGLGSFTAANGTLFFAGNDGANNWEPWKSDGTTAGTVMISNINSIGSSSPQEFTNVNGTVFFTADNGGTGRNLWKSDGTDAGTVMVIEPTAFSNPQRLANMNGTLYFSATNAAYGTEPWVSHGTYLDTTMLKDVSPATLSSSPQGFTFLNGSVYFVASDPTGGTELWKTDGTQSGTARVADVFPGPDSSIIVPNPVIVSAGNAIVFRADDGVYGPEVWATDGTAANTHMVADVASAGPAGSIPEFFVEAGGLVYFAATIDQVGRELFAIPIAALMDSDLDGLDAAAELMNHTDPFRPDSDDDGLSDSAEVNIYHTSPIGFDTDNDGFDDGEEIAFGTDPLDPASFPPSVPLFGPLGLGLLAALLLASGALAQKRRRPCA